jgi:8-oxo-dGTP diphosphatase
VAAVIFNQAGQVLIARRHDYLHQGGKWEFPGGKIEPGESPIQALRRELFEELGIQARTFEPLIRTRYRYPDQAVELDVWRVTRYDGVCQSLEEQPLAWLAPADLACFAFPAANLPILKALRLPDLYLITPAPGRDLTAFLNGLETALSKDIRLVQLRAPGLDAHRYGELAKAAIELCHAHGARLLINGEPRWATRLNADGVHLNSARLSALEKRPLPENYLVAASCHSVEEIARANAIDADFIIVSPVKVTRSHPEAKALGWSAFSRLCAEAAAPAYALGGMSVADLTRAKHCGGQGIAAIRGLWPGSVG